MKNMKKFVALATAAVMVIAPTTALAAESSLQGGVNYVPTTIYKVTLPTTEGMDFTLDPQGLSGLDETNDQSTLDTNKGKIVGTNLKMTATNESSVDVKLSAKFYIEADGVTLDSGTITDNEVPSMAMVIATTDGTTTSINVDKSAAEDVTASEFTMTAADYEFHNTDDGGYEYVLTEDSGSTLDFTIGGTVATDADWSDYTGEDAKPITLKAVFAFTDAATGDSIEIETEPTYTPADGFIQTTTSGDYELAVDDENGFSETISKVVVLVDGEEVEIAYEQDEYDWAIVLWDDMVDAGVEDADGTATFKVYCETTVYTMTTTW